MNKTRNKIIVAGIIMCLLTMFHAAAQYEDMDLDQGQNQSINNSNVSVPDEIMTNSSYEQDININVNASAESEIAASDTLNATVVEKNKSITEISRKNITRTEIVLNDNESSNMQTVKGMENTSANYSDDEKITITRLQLKQIFEAISDFIFKLKLVLLGEYSAKLEALKSRNAELEDRQQEWLVLKEKALENIKSGNITQEEKKRIITEIQEEHEKIIKEHIVMTSEIREIELKATARGESQVTIDAQTAANIVEGSSVSEGLDVDKDSMLTDSGRILSQEEILDIMTNEFNLKNTRIDVKSDSGAMVYVVTGQETDEFGGFNLIKDYEINVSASSGVVLSVEIATDIEEANATSLPGPQINESIEDATENETMEPNSTSTNMTAGNETLNTSEQDQSDGENIYAEANSSSDADVNIGEGDISAYTSAETDAKIGVY